MQVCRFSLVDALVVRLPHLVGGQLLTHVNPWCVGGTHSTRQDSEPSPQGGQGPAVQRMSLQPGPRRGGAHEVGTTCPPVATSVRGIGIHTNGLASVPLLMPLGSLQNVEVSERLERSLSVDLGLGLAPRYVVHVRWPDDWASMERDQKEDTLDYRYKLGETLKEACRIMGGAYCVNRLATKLTEAMNLYLQVRPKRGDWRLLESQA